MKTLFDANDREALLARIAQLRTDSARQWGKMSPAQALRHCAVAMETATGDRPMKQAFIGKVLAPLVRKKVLGEAPFGKGSPTDPTFRIADDCDIDAERTHLTDTIARFVTRGPAEAGKAMHPFFGKLSGDEWGTLMYKHVDHHLRQFGA